MTLQEAKEIRAKQLKYKDWEHLFNSQSKDGLETTFGEVIKIYTESLQIEDINKPILDACCGSKMFWFDKENPKVLFADIRSEVYTLCDGRPLVVKPDQIHDFRKMPYPDNSFKMVVLDPPHMKKLGKDTWMAQKYGVLLPTWEDDIRAGMDECMRVLQPHGTLIFKWNEAQITLNKVLSVINHKPLFGHVTGKHGRTIWLAFMKF